MDKITQTSFFYKKFSLILVVSMLCVAGTIYAQDTDGDTVLDQFDLDDDNDGILDTLESDCDLTGATNVGLIWDPNIFSGTEVNSRTNFNTGDPKVDRYEPSRFDASVGLPTEFAQLTVSNTGIGMGLTDLSSSDPAVNVVVQSGYYYLGGVDETSAANAKLNNDYLEFSFTMRSDRTVILRSSNIQDVPTSVPGVYEQRGIDLRQSFTDPTDFIVPMLVDFSYQIEISTDNFTTSTVLVPGKTTVRRTDGTSFTNSADDAMLPSTDPNFFQYEELDIFPFYQLIPNETYTIRMFIYSAEDQSSQGRVSFDNFRINVSDCTRFDTDNDSIADQFDLDSDADNCPDVLEGAGSFTMSDLMTSAIAGGSTNIQSNLTGTTGATNVNLSNGLVDLGSGDITQGVGVAQDDTDSSACPVIVADDFDNDGIPDSVDVDDDNDGILDTVEDAECATNVGNLDFNLQFNNLVANSQTTQVLRAAAWQADISDAGTQVGRLYFTALRNGTANLYAPNYTAADWPAPAVSIENSSDGETIVASFGVGANNIIVGGVNVSSVSFAQYTATIENTTATTQEYTLSYVSNASEVPGVNLGINHNSSPGTLEAIFDTSKVTATVTDYNNANLFDPITSLHTSGFTGGAETVPVMSATPFTITNGASGIVGTGGNTANSVGYSINYTVTLAAGESTDIVAIDRGAINVDNYGFLVSRFVPCVADTDNDGIPNSLDLDSDGDGCPDSVEAGVPLTNGDLGNADVENGSGGTVTSTVDTANAQLDTSGVDTTPQDGLNDSVDANGDGIPDYTSTYYLALSDALDVCADNDNDGIGDLVDIDDDNDGVLDTTELGCGVGTATNTSQTNTANAQSVSGQFTNGTAIADYTVNFTDVNLAFTAASVIVGNGVHYLLNDNDADGDFSENISITTSGTSVLNTISYGAQTNTNPVVATSRDNDQQAITLTWSPAVIATVIDPDGQLDVANGTNITSGTIINQTADQLNGLATWRIEFAVNLLTSFNLTASHDHNTANAISLESYGFNASVCELLDTDNDGITNHLDLDSDGDGCPDSVEAGLPLSNGDLVTASIENGSGGTVTSTTSTANAQLDTSGTDTTPEDGLNDSVDANGDGIPDYTSTYNLIALSDILDGCADFDNDGIGDLADIDDDNDGIVDAEESPSCFFLETEWTEGDRTTLITVTSDINSFNTTYTYENMVDGETANAQANQARYQNGQTVTGNTIIQFEFERAVNINEIIFQLQSTSSFMNTTVFATLQGSNDGTNWMDLTTSFDYQVTESDNEVNVFVTQNADLYSFYRLQGDAGTTTQNGIVNEVTFNFNDYVASKYFKSTCTEDLDDDGILNHLDLDSDGDDCPDSVEANVSPTTGRGQGTIENGTGGAVTTTTPNVDDAVFTFVSDSTNDSNGDGLLDTIDGATVDGITEYTSTFTENGLDASRDACLDSDDDGVGDLVDVDDDNDGILDTVECFVPCLPSNSGLTVATIPNRTWTVRAFRSEHPANTRQDCDDTTTTIGSLMEFEYGNGTYDSPNGLNIGNPRITTLNSIANYTTWNVTGGAIPGTPFLVMFEYTMQAGDEGYYTFSTDAADGQILFGNSCNGRQQRIVCDDWFGVQLNLTKPNYYAEGDVLRYLVTEWGVGSNWIEMQVTKYDIPTAQLAIINCDFDGDGITNDLDLDSDGDGCTDAEEAGVLEITGLTTGDVINGTGGAGNTTTSNVDNARFVFISPTNDTNNDGLFDAADGAIQDGMPEYRLTYQQYATTTIFDACIDNDNDGISDIADIDDDNDGVVDAEESPSCFVTAVEAVIPSRITSDFGSPDDDQSDGDIQLLHDGANTLAFNFDSVPSTGEGTTLFALEYPTFVNLSAIQISDNITTTATSRAQLYGSFDGAIWRLLTATEIPTNTTPIQFTIDQNAGDYQFYEIRMTEYAALSTANTIGEITATLATGYVASAHPKSSCTEDNDDDGILNHLDLDSDGDGCPDSVEANAMPRTAIGQGTLENGTGGAVTTTTTNVDNAQFIFDQTTNSGNDDTNNDGLLDSIDDNGGTGTLDGTPEYTSTYTTFALDKNTDACLDSDGDSIADVFDIDDDNDGILDTEEQIECTASGIISVSSATSTSPITDIGLLVDGILDQTRMTFSSLSSYTTDITVEFASSQTGDIKFELYNDGGTQNNGGSTASGIGEFDSVEVYDSSGALIYSQAGFLIPGFATGDTSVLDSTQDIHLIFDEQLIDATTVIVKGIVGYNGDSDPSVSSTFAVEEVREFLFTKTCSATLTHFDQDTDADGVPNRLDLDSDGDGCPDAVEAGVPLTNGDLGNADVENGSGGAVTSTVNTANAQLDPNATDSTPEDGLNDSVDANGDGIPDYNSTYETFALDNTVDACLDSDGDMIADVFDVDDDNDGILDVDEGCTSPDTYDLGVFQSDFNTTVGGTLNPYTFINIDGQGLDITYSVSGDVSDVLLGGSGTGTSGISPGIITNSVGNAIHINANDAGNDDPLIVNLDFSKPIAGATFGFYDVDGDGVGFDDLTVVIGYDVDDNVILPSVITPGSVSEVYDASNEMFNYPSDGVSPTLGLRGTASSNSQINPSSVTFSNFKEIKRIEIYYGNSDAILNPMQHRFYLDLTTFSSCTQGLDLDKDGIINSLDLDSDGDGCPDAVEGDLSFEQTDLSDASATLLNQPNNNNNDGSISTGYLGSTTESVLFNLGTTVDTNPSSPTYGVPLSTLANTPNTQGIGGSQDVNDDTSCCDIVPPMIAPN